MEHRSTERSRACADSAAAKKETARSCAGRCKVNVMFAGVGDSMPAQANTATQPKWERDRQEESIWRELSVFPKKKKDADLWRPGPPATEALALFRMIGKNGDTVESLRK